MRPKPTREWVMAELERLNVRVVSGRPSKELNGTDEDGTGDGVGGIAVKGTNGDMPLNQDSTITPCLLNAAEIARGLGFDTNSILNQQRRSSLAMSMSLLDDGRDSTNIAAAARAVMGNGRSNNNALDPASGVQNHRPLVGGGSAAAYEAARADYYRRMSEQKNKPSQEANEVNEPARRLSSFTGASRGVSSLGGLLNNIDNVPMGGPIHAINANNANRNPSLGGNGGSFGLSINPNAHYEMLKLHHMNLLNEIQETTLMMNLYQQQQLQQQQQQQHKLQQEQQLLVQQRLLGQQQSMRNNSLGMGTVNSQDNITSSATSDHKPDLGNDGRPQSSTRATAEAPPRDIASEVNDHEKQLAKIKAEIEERQRMLHQLEKSSSSAVNAAKESERSKDATSAANNNDNTQENAIKGKRKANDMGASDDNDPECKKTKTVF